MDNTTKLNTKKNIDSFLQICIAFVLFGVVSKVKQWPNHEIILLSASGLFTLVYPFSFYLIQNKKTIDYIKLALAIIWGLATISSTLKLPYSDTISYITLGIFVLWFFFRNIKQENRVSTVLFTLSVLGVLIGSLFNFLGWEGGGILLSSGIVFGCIWALLGFLKKPQHKTDDIDNIGKS